MPGLGNTAVTPFSGGVGLAPERPERSRPTHARSSRREDERDNESRTDRNYPNCNNVRGKDGG